ncbi:MAG: hypothetical protein ACU833_15400, partial [Gammaproteobacteria bacterium]
MPAVTNGGLAIVSMMGGAGNLWPVGLFIWSLAGLLAFYIILFAHDIGTNNKSDRECMEITEQEKIEQNREQ